MDIVNVLRKDIDMRDLDDYGFLKIIERDDKRNELVINILTRALTTDGAHHKQYAIEEVLKILGCDLKKINYEKGIP